MKDSMVNSNNDKASPNSSLRRLKTFTDLSQAPETSVLSGQVESPSSISAINPIDLLAITPNVQAATSLSMETPPEVIGPGNELNTQNDALALDGTQASTTFAAHLEEKIKPKLEQWREYNKINKNQIPDEAIINRSQIDALVKTVTKALTLFPGHPTLLDISQIAHEIAVISETEWKSVQTVAMNDTLSAFNKIINALTHTAESLQDTHNDTMAYWDEYEQEQLQILKNSSAALLLEHQLGSLDNIDSELSKAADDLVEQSFKNSTEAFKTKLNTLLFEKVKQHKAERISTLTEASKRATKASQKAFDSSLNKMPALKADSQSSKEIQHILPNLFFESGQALKNAAADFDKAQHALKKPRSTSYKIIKTTYTLGKKTGALLKSSAQSINAENILDFAQRVEKANSDVDDFMNTKLPSLAKRGGYIIQRLALSSKKWGKSLAPSGQDSIDFDASLSVTPLEILAATQDLLVATTNLLASGHAAIKAAESAEIIKKQAHNIQTTLVNDSSGQFKPALSEKQALNRLTQQAIETLITIEQEALTKKARKFNYRKEVANKKAFKLEEAKTAALQVAPRVQTLAADEAFKASMEATLNDIDPRFKQKAERKLLSLSNTIKPAANVLFEAATDLVNSATLHTETQSQIELMIAEVKNVENKIRNVKATIKLALTQMIGHTLHNYSHRGLLAKDIGQFIASEKAAYLKDNPGVESEVDLAIVQMLSTLQSDLTTSRDHQGKVLDKWVKMAVKDAENDAVSWPASLEDMLSQYPKIKEYLHEWGAKKFNYNLLLGIISTSLQDSARTLERLASIHPKKNLLRPRMGYLKVLLMPFTIPIAIHGLRQATRVGENPQSAIKKFLKREAGKLAFRLLTLVLPSAATTALAGGLTFSGLYKGGKYNEEFLEKAKKRMAFNLLSSAIEQPFMLAKTRHVNLIKNYFSLLENTPAFSSIPSFDEKEDDQDMFYLTSEIESIEYSEAETNAPFLVNESHADSFPSSAATTAQDPHISNSVNLTENIIQRINVDDTETVDKINAQQATLPITQAQSLDPNQDELVVPQGDDIVSDQGMSTEPRPLAPEIYDDSSSSSATTNETGARKKRSVNPSENTRLQASDEDTKRADNSDTKNNPEPISNAQLKRKNKFKVISLLRSIAKIKRNLSQLQEQEAPPSVINAKQKELDDKEREFAAFCKPLPDKLVAEATNLFIRIDIYALNMLEEMKAYYPKAVGRIWNNFDPDQKINFSFYKTNPNDPTRRITIKGKTTLANFLNGRVRKFMIDKNSESPIIFEGSYARTEVAADINTAATEVYTPGAWSKNKALKNLVSPEDSNKGIARPLSTDIVTVKVYTDKTTIIYKKITLDEYISNRYLTASEKSLVLNNNPEVTWPTHYHESWQKTFNTQNFRDNYMRGDTAIKMSALSRPSISNSVKVLATRLWEDENFSKRISDHPQLKSMTPDSIITFEEIRFGITKRTSMSFLDFITDGRHLIKNSDATVITDPPGLTLNDPLLKEMIEANVVARNVIAQVYDVGAAASRINIPHPVNILQEELDNAVVEKQTGTGSFRHLKLTDKVKVNYAGSWIYQPANVVGNITTLLSRIGLMQEEIRETKEFSVYEIMQNKHLKYAISKSYEHTYISPDNNYDPAVIKKLSDTDWQAHLEAKYQALKNDPKLLKNWKTVIIPLVSQHGNTSEKPFHTVHFNGLPMSGVYAVSKPDGRFEIRSVHNTTYFEFSDDLHMLTAFNKGYPSSTFSTPEPTIRPSLQPGQKDDKFYSWLTSHMSEDQKNAAAEIRAQPFIPTISLAHVPAPSGISNLGQNAEDLASNLFALLFDQRINDTDALIKSDAELLGHLIFQALTDSGPYLAAATSLVSGGIGIGVGLLLAATPFAELLLSDSAQESREIFWMALMNAAIDYNLDFAIKPTIKKFIKSGVPFLSNSFKALTKTAKLFDPSYLKITKLDSWSHVSQELILMGKTKYKTAKILSTKFNAPRYDKDMKLISNKSDAISTALTIAHPSVIYNSPFMAAKGDLVVFISTPQTTMENDKDEHEVKHVMVCLGNGLFSGVGNDVLDPTLSSDKQIFTAEDLMKIRDRGLHNMEDVSSNIPLTIKVLKTEDESVEPEPPKKRLYIPRKQYAGVFGDIAIWQNLSGFFTFEHHIGTSELIIRNSLSQTITVTCVVSDTGTHWTMQWSPELLPSSDVDFIESDSLDDLTVKFETLLKNCPDIYLQYEVTLPDGFKETGHIQNFVSFIAFEDSPQVLDHPLPETNGYWDNTLNNLSKEQWAAAIRKYSENKPNIDLSIESELFNFLTTLHRHDTADDQPNTEYSLDQVKKNYNELISSRTIAGTLSEILKSAGYTPPEGSHKSPFSKQGLAKFLQALTNRVSSELILEFDHSKLTASTLNADQINKDFSLMTSKETFSIDFTEWILPLIYKNKNAI